VIVAGNRFPSRMSAQSPATSHLFKDADALVVYASTQGSTAKIAMRIATAMRAQGLEVDLREVAQASNVKPGCYGLVVVGASLQAAHHQQQIVDWARERRDALRRVPSVLFSVAPDPAADSADPNTVAEQSVDEFCAETGWTPDRIERIAC
jgi:menaquinone-dependent protoporphyrinogen IX oxidase